MYEHANAYICWNIGYYNNNKNQLFGDTFMFHCYVKRASGNIYTIKASGNIYTIKAVIYFSISYVKQKYAQKKNYKETTSKCYFWVVEL